MKHKGTPFMLLGLLFIAAAVLLMLHNREIDSAAQESAQNVTADLSQAIEENALYTSLLDEAELSSGSMTSVSSDSEPIKTIVVNDTEYLGLLEIPTLSLSLPIRAGYSTAGLEDAPCRYTGGADTENLVIAGHNYTSHFGKLQDLSIGDSVYLKNADGSVCSYTVRDIEILSPYDVDDMCAGDWPLTLFTCTYGGQNRLTIRCGIADSQ